MIHREWLAIVDLWQTSKDYERVHVGMVCALLILACMKALVIVLKLARLARERKA